MRPVSVTQTGAKGFVSGTVSNGATWIEQFEINQNDMPVTGADTSTWKFTFKRPGCTTVALTLTSGTEITVTQGTTATIFAISTDVPTTICGDYHADFAEETSGGNVIHWLHGTVTFLEESLGF